MTVFYYRDRSDTVSKMGTKILSEDLKPPGPAVNLKFLATERKDKALEFFSQKKEDLVCFRSHFFRQEKKEHI